MTTDYKALALQMNRFYCIGEGHLASDLLLDAINKDKDNPNNETSHAPTSDYTDYLLNELDRIQKELATLTTEITKWTQNKMTTKTYTDEHGNIVCSLHMDASVMNKHDQCDECLDDAHELEILAR